MDEYGNETYDMKTEVFQVAVPIRQINKTLNENIFISRANVKTFPVFYAFAENEKLQDYIISAGTTENIGAEFNYKIIPEESNLKVIKQDEETKKPISGVKFNAKYSESGENIGDYITDENGEIEIPNLRPEKIILTELETLEQYELNNIPLEIKMNYGENKEITIYNKYKKGKLKVIKTDKEDDSIKLEGVEFDLIDKNSNIVSHLVTNENGEAILDGINIGEYILKETKTKEEYKISLEDKNVTIKWNEESVITISNEKKKGQIEVVKVDKEDNTIKLKGVEFEVLDKNDNVVDKIITDENGIAKTSLLPIGTYYLREISTDENHILNEQIIETVVKEDVTSSVIVENERIKGQIKIVKTRITKNEIIYKAKIEIGNQELEINVLLDTGNMLKDPISGDAVIMVEKNMLYKIVPKELIDNMNKFLGGEFENADNLEYKKRIRFIPFTSVGKQNGMLLGIKADLVKIITDVDEIINEKAIIGVYEKTFSKSGKYSGLIGLDILERSEADEHLANIKK